jgi:iron(II)-dependent oxidoreductase
MDPMDPWIAHLEDARARTLALASDLDDAQWMGPRLDIVNPMRWELGHIAWFQEKWLMRHVRGQAPLRADGDSLYDSARVAHDTRWDLPLPSRADTLRYMRTILDRVRAPLERTHADEHERYFLQLATFHEDMHGEALTYTRQTLRYAAPPAATVATGPLDDAGSLSGDVDVPGGTFVLGAIEGRDPFVFDNEKWGHRVEVAPFRIARAAVTNAEFAAFVDSGAYTDDRFWTDDGASWRKRENATHPVYWVRADDAWRLRRYDGIASLRPHAAVIHVNAFEAEAYCAWAGRRLPTEAEWELAASGFEKRRFPWGDEPPDASRANLDARLGEPSDVAAFPEGDSPFGCRQMIGNVWEWTATRFAPYPGFVVDPYAEYSEPWFHTPHRVLRGGCWATRARLLRNSWRNFYPPHRRDVFGGFRTCAG